MYIQTFLYYNFLMYIFFLKISKFLCFCLSNICVIYLCQSSQNCKRHEGCVGRIYILSLFFSWQLNAPSQNSVSSWDVATLAGEISRRYSLKPGITDCGIPNPMAPAQKPNLSISWLVTQDSLPIHWREGKGLLANSSNRILISPNAVNATIIKAVDLRKYVIKITLKSYLNREPYT